MKHQAQPPIEPVPPAAPQASAANPIPEPPGPAHYVLVDDVDHLIATGRVRQILELRWFR